jgi:hypothetical protein
MDLYGLKEDTMEVGKLGAAALAGAAIAKIVVDKGADLIAPTKVKTATEGGAKDQAEADANKKSALRKFIMPLVPVAVGIGVHSYGKSQFPIAAPGVAAGMVAFGLGRLLGNVLAPTTSAGNVDVTKLADSAVSFLPFGHDTGLNGFGYVYDYSLQGLGYGPGDVTRYMNGAPTQVQSLMGAPLQVQALAGLGASPNTVSVVGPMSATLM